MRNPKYRWLVELPEDNNSDTANTIIIKADHLSVNSSGDLMFTRITAGEDGKRETYPCNLQAKGSWVSVEALGQD